MNSVNQREWDDERRKLEWREGIRRLRYLADKMQKEEINEAAFWNIQLLLLEDLPMIFTHGQLPTARKEEKENSLTPFQKVSAHPKGALAILRFLRGAITGNEKETELAMQQVANIYEEIFDEPAMMPRFIGEMLHGI